MIFDILTYMKGTVTCKVSGVMPEKFINLCMMEKKVLLSITKKKDDIIICMGLSDFLSIRPLVRKSKNHLEVISYSGLPFITRRIKRRKMLLVGAMIFLLLLNLLMSYIWFVDIIGLQTLSAIRIKEFADQNGLKPGTLKNTVNTKLIENQILFSFPEVAWVGIHFTGTRVVIEIVEKTIPKEVDKAPADIVAIKDGVISEIIPLAGQSAVKKGDTVKKGDILIKGVLYEQKPTNSIVPDTLPQLNRANGIVKARVWYESYGEVAFVQTVYQRTGREETGVALRMGNEEFVLKKVNVDPNKRYEVEVTNKKLPWWRNREFIVESNISRYYETDPMTITLSIEEAREQAKVIALEKIQSLIPETAQVVRRNIEILKIAEKNLIRIKVHIETAEDIGQLINRP